MATEPGHAPNTIYTLAGGGTQNFPSGTTVEYFSGATITVDSGVTESHANAGPTFTNGLTVAGGTTDLGVAATSGFLAIPATTGTPTGSMVNPTGGVFICYDRINKLIYVQVTSGTWVKYATA